MPTSEPASYTVELAPDGSFVHYRSLTSARTAAEMAQRLRAAVDLGRAHSLTRLLYDVRGVLFQAGLAAQYEYAYNQARQLGLTSNWRIALLATPGDRSYDFMETAFINAGYMAQLFTGYERAAEWLCGPGEIKQDPELPY